MQQPAGLDLIFTTSQYFSGPVGDPLVVRRGIYQPQLERWRTHFPDEQIEVIRDYARTFDTMDDETASALARRALDVDEREQALLREQIGQVAEAAKQTSTPSAADQVHAEDPVNGRIDVDEYRDRHLVQDTGSGCQKRIAGHEHFIARPHIDRR